MSKLTSQLLLAFFAISFFMSSLPIVAAEPTAEPQAVDLADGYLQLPVPAAWKQVKPRSRIIKHEFSIPALGDDKLPGRMTIMAASGGLEANIARWVGQFKSSEGKPLAADAKKIEKKKVSGLDVHLVDLAGDFPKTHPVISCSSCQKLLLKLANNAVQKTTAHKKCRVSMTRNPAFCFNY